MGEKGSQRTTGVALAQHGDDRVVARDRPGDARQRCLVNTSGDEVGRAGWSPNDRQRAYHLDRQDELANQGGGAAIALTGADQSELVNVARDRRLSYPKPALRERCGDVVLSVRAAAADEVEDRLLALVFARNRGPAH